MLSVEDILQVPTTQYFCCPCFILGRSAAQFPPFFCSSMETTIVCYTAGRCQCCHATFLQKRCVTILKTAVQHVPSSGDIAWRARFPFDSLSNACHAGHWQYPVLAFTKTVSEHAALFARFSPVTRNILGYSLFCDRSQDGVCFRHIFESRNSSDK